MEALAILAVTAVIAGAATASLSGAARSAGVEDVAGRFTAFDRAARDLARGFGRTPALRVELSRGTVERVEDGRDASPLALGGAVRPTRVLVRGRSVTAGAVSVPFSARGQSPSYAVLLTGPAGARWVVFAGLSGQASVLNDERDVQDILSAASDRRADPR